MTTQQSYKYSAIIGDAWALEDQLSPFCERIELAGSIRRQCDTIGDIELVAIPRYHEITTDLFGATERVSSLDVFLNGLLRDGIIQDAPHKRWGDKLKSFVFEAQFSERRFKVDLFIQPDPATWSCNMVTRTGSADFSHWMVTSRSKGGALPDDCKWKNARIWQKGNPVNLPEEKDLFQFLELDYIPPEKRDRGRWGLFS